MRQCGRPRSTTTMTSLPTRPILPIPSKTPSRPPGGRHARPRERASPPDRPKRPISRRRVSSPTTTAPGVPSRRSSGDCVRASPSRVPCDRSAGPSFFGAPFSRRCAFRPGRRARSCRGSTCGSSSRCSPSSRRSCRSGSSSAGGMRRSGSRSRPANGAFPTRRPVGGGGRFWATPCFFSASREARRCLRANSSRSSPQSPPS